MKVASMYKYFTILFDNLHSTLYMFLQFVTPWRWLRFSAETRRDNKTNFTISFKNTCVFV
jgi:hypothetical protein